MEIYSSNGPIVFFESVKACSHTIIPELDVTIMQGGKNPRSDGMKAQTLDSVALTLELRQHFIHICKANKSLPRDVNRYLIQNISSLCLESTQLISQRTAEAQSSSGYV